MQRHGGGRGVTAGPVTGTCRSLDEGGTGSGAGAGVGADAEEVARVVLLGVVVRCYVSGLYHEGRWRGWPGDLYVCIGSTGDIGHHLRS